jgi:hypothetical protein
MGAWGSCSGQGVHRQRRVYCRAPKGMVDGYGCWMAVRGGGFGVGWRWRWRVASGEWVMGGWQTVKFHRMLRAVGGRRVIVDIICI